MIEIQNYTPPSWDETFMKLAYVMAERSKDPRTKVGSVIIKDKRVITTGYNGLPINVQDHETRLERPAKYEYIVHAEANAVVQGSYIGVSVRGGILYVNSFPCSECCKLIIQSGISEIVFHGPWLENEDSGEITANWMKSRRVTQIMLEEAKIPYRMLNKKLGVIGYLNGKIINV